MKWPLGFTLIVHGYQSKWGSCFKFMIQSCYKEIITAKICQIIHALSSLDTSKPPHSMLLVSLDFEEVRIDNLIVKRYVLDLKFFVQKLLFYYLGLSLILNNGARERMQSCVKHYQARDGENQ